MTDEEAAPLTREELRDFRRMKREWESGRSIFTVLCWLGGVAVALAVLLNNGWQFLHGSKP